MHLRNANCVNISAQRWAHTRMYLRKRAPSRLGAPSFSPPTTTGVSMHLTRSLDACESCHLNRCAKVSLLILKLTHHSCLG